METDDEQLLPPSWHTLGPAFALSQQLPAPGIPASFCKPVQPASIACVDGYSPSFDRQSPFDFDRSRSPSPPPSSRSEHHPSQPAHIPAMTLKNRRSLQPLFVPPFLRPPSPPNTSPTHTATHLRSNSAAATTSSYTIPPAIPIEDKNAHTTSSTPLTSPGGSPPSDLLDDDPFANLSPGPSVITVSVPPARARSASLPRLRPPSSSDAGRESVAAPTPRSPLARSALLDERPTMETMILPSFSSFEPTLPSTPPPTPLLTGKMFRGDRAFGSSQGQVRPAYTRPAFRPRPSLPSLHTLAQAQVVVPKVRRGRVGAQLPFEPWESQPSDSYTSASEQSEPETTSENVSPSIFTEPQTPRRPSHARRPSNLAPIRDSRLIGEGEVDTGVEPQTVPVDVTEHTPSETTFDEAASSSSSTEPSPRFVPEELPQGHRPSLSRRPSGLTTIRDSRLITEELDELSESPTSVFASTSNDDEETELPTPTPSSSTSITVPPPLVSSSDSQEEQVLPESENRRASTSTFVSATTIPHPHPPLIRSFSEPYPSSAAPISRSRSPSPCSLSHPHPHLSLARSTSDSSDSSFPSLSDESSSYPSSSNSSMPCTPKEFEFPSTSSSSNMEMGEMESLAMFPRTSFYLDIADSLDYDLAEFALSLDHNHPHPHARDVGYSSPRSRTSQRGVVLGSLQVGMGMGMGGEEEFEPGTSAETIRRLSSSQTRVPMTIPMSVPIHTTQAQVGSRRVSCRDDDVTSDRAFHHHHHHHHHQEDDDHILHNPYAHTHDRHHDERNDLRRTLDLEWTSTYPSETSYPSYQSYPSDTSYPYAYTSSSDSDHLPPIPMPISPSSMSSITETETSMTTSSYETSTSTSTSSECGLQMSGLGLSRGMPGSFSASGIFGALEGSEEESVSEYGAGYGTDFLSFSDGSSDEGEDVGEVRRERRGEDGRESEREERDDENEEGGGESSAYGTAAESLDPELELESSSPSHSRPHSPSFKSKSHLKSEGRRGRVHTPPPALALSFASGSRPPVRRSLLAVSSPDDEEKEDVEFHSAVEEVGEGEEGDVDDGEEVTQRFPLPPASTSTSHSQDDALFELDADADQDLISTNDLNAEMTSAATRAQEKRNTMSGRSTHSTNTRSRSSSLQSVLKLSRESSLRSCVSHLSLGGNVVGVKQLRSGPSSPGPASATFSPGPSTATLSPSTATFGPSTATFGPSSPPPSTTSFSIRSAGPSSPKPFSLSSGPSSPGASATSFSVRSVLSSPRAGPSSPPPSYRTSYNTLSRHTSVRSHQSHKSSSSIGTSNVSGGEMVDTGDYSRQKSGGSSYHYSSSGGGHNGFSGYGNGNGNGESISGSGWGRSGGSGRGRDDEDDDEWKRRRPVPRSDVPLRDTSSSDEEEGDNNDEDEEQDNRRHRLGVGMGVNDGRSSKLSTSSHVKHPSSSSTDDDVPLAQQIPTALRAQKTIRRQVREERLERKATSKRNASPLPPRPPSSSRAPIAGPSKVEAMSSTQEAMMQAQSVAPSKPFTRARTKTLPSNSTNPFSMADLTSKLLGVQADRSSSSRRPSAEIPNRISRERSMDPPSHSPLNTHPKSFTQDYYPDAQQAARSLKHARSFHRPSAAAAHNAPLPLPLEFGGRLGRSATSASRSPLPPPSPLPPADNTLDRAKSIRSHSRRPSVESPRDDPRTLDRARSIRTHSRRPSTERGDHSSSSAGLDRTRSLRSHSRRPSAEDPDGRRSQSRPPLPPLPSAEVLSTLPPPPPKPIQMWQQRVFVNSLQSFCQVEVSAATTAGEVLRILESQNALPGGSGGGWMLWEVCQDFGMERPIRSFELLSDVSASWNADKTVNVLMVKKTAMAPLLSRTAIPSSSPICSGSIQWEYKRGKWQKRWMELREHSLWLSKKDNGKDQVFLCSLSNFDAYTMTRPYKSPKPFVFAVKSTDNLSFFEDTSDYMHIFSCGESEGQNWLEKILLARSYVVYQERNVLTNTSVAASNGGASLSRAGTRKQRPAQPLVNFGGASAASADVPPVPAMFEPGSLLAKRT